jgi:SAM-dependent methyltransferase
VGHAFERHKESLRTNAPDSNARPLRMDDLSRYNRDRWNALAAAGVEFSLPWLDLDQATARVRIDALGLLGDLAGKRVLCLAGGGGQQSAAFGILGAIVTVFDLSDEMLARDQAAAAHYKTDICTIQGDLRDMSALEDDSFDVVWHAHSLTFVPDINPIYDGVSRVLRTGGIYHVSAWNPLAYGADERWTGEGYLLRGSYVEGAEAVSGEGVWDFVDGDGHSKQVAAPREFQHTLTALVNGLIQRGFVLLNLHEEPDGNTSATPGSWDHFCSVVPPWICIWALKRPELLKRT